MPEATLIRPSPGDLARENLKRANDVRSKRARLKRDLAAGRSKLVPVLLDPPRHAAGAKVRDLLECLPGVGRVKAARLMNRAQISFHKTVEGLSDRQRVTLVKELR